MNGKITYFATLVNEKSFNAKISFNIADFMKFYLDQMIQIQYKLQIHRFHQNMHQMWLSMHLNIE